MKTITMVIVLFIKQLLWNNYSIKIIKNIEDVQIKYIAATNNAVQKPPIMDKIILQPNTKMGKSTIKINWQQHRNHGANKLSMKEIEFRTKMSSMKLFAWK